MPDTVQTIVGRSWLPSTRQQFAFVISVTCAYRVHDEPGRLDATLADRRLETAPYSLVSCPSSARAPGCVGSRPAAVGI